MVTATILSMLKRCFAQNSGMTRNNLTGQGTKTSSPLDLMPVTLAVGLIFSGCASQAPAPQTPPTNQNAPGNPSNSIQELPASTWQVNFNGVNRSLPEILAMSGKQSLIFQFAGVTCDTCQKDAEDYTRLIAASPKQTQIGHVVVFTDFPEDFLESDFTRFMSTFAPNSLRAADPQAKVWISLQKNPALPDRNVIVVLGQGSQGFFTNEPSTTSQIHAILESLAGGGIR